MISRRENLLQVLRGEKPQWVPFSINFSQWFDHHRRFDTLPEEMQTCEGYIDAMKVLGEDIFSRNPPSGFRIAFDLPVKQEEHVKPNGNIVTTTTYTTPFGDLRDVKEFLREETTTFEIKALVTDWTTEGRAFRYLLEALHVEWNEEVFQATREKIGDDGVLLLKCAQTPLKFLHIYFHVDQATFFIVDYPEDAQQVCDILYSKIKPWYEKLARHSDVDAVILMDNTDTPFYPPRVARKYWAPYVKELAEIMDAAGKTLWSHSCGQLKKLKPLFAETKIHGLEGLTHPPLGDWEPWDALNTHDKFIYNGGFSAHEQSEKTDDEVIQWMKTLFGHMQKFDYRRFIFAASCQTAINTSYARIKLVRDLCRELGGDPNTLVFEADREGV